MACFLSLTQASSCAEVRINHHGSSSLLRAGTSGYYLLAPEGQCLVLYAVYCVRCLLYSLQRLYTLYMLQGGRDHECPLYSLTALLTHLPLGG